MFKCTTNHQNSGNQPKLMRPKKSPAIETRETFQPPNSGNQPRKRSAEALETSKGNHQTSKPRKPARKKTTSLKKLKKLRALGNQQPQNPQKLHLPPKEIETRLSDDWWQGPHLGIWVIFVTQMKVHFL